MPQLEVQVLEAPEAQEVLERLEEAKEQGISSLSLTVDQYSGPSPDPNQVGAGADGGAGGAGATGGRGQDGSNGVSLPIFPTTFSPSPIPSLGSRVVQITEIGYCSNSEITLTKNGGTWGFSAASIVNDLSPQSSSFNNTSSPIRVSFGNTGQHDVVIDGITLTGYINIVKPRAAPQLPDEVSGGCFGTKVITLNSFDASPSYEWLVYSASSDPSTGELFTTNPAIFTPVRLVLLLLIDVAFPWFVHCQTEIGG